jgi:hypothetical protein
MAAAAEELSSQMGQFKVDGGQDFSRDTLPQSYSQTEPQPASRSASQQALAPPRAAASKGREARDAKTKKQAEDEFFKVDDLDGFEEF